MGRKIRPETNPLIINFQREYAKMGKKNEYLPHTNT